MALYETLIDGGHEHLIDAVKARIAQKADAIIEDELKPIIENQPSSTLEGELLVADDAADLPPVMVGVDGRSTQAGTPTPDAPVPIESVDSVELHASADGTTDYGNWPVTLYDGTLRSLPNGTKDTLALTYLRPSTREGWAWYSREVVQKVWPTTLGSTRSYTVVSTSGGKLILRANQSNMFVTSSRAIPRLLCDVLTPYETTTTTNIDNIPNNSICPRSGETQMFIRCDSATAPYNEYFADTTLLVPLATPITTQLDPIELPVLPAPTCTVWADPTANLKLTYVIDFETIEESLESGIGKAFSSVAPVETSPATSNHSAGSRIVYNETLYKVTSAIAAGEDIVPGTNVTATTVAAELLATQA